MLHMIGHAAVGLLIGLFAKLLLPGADPGGIIVTALLGMVGGWLGGFIGRALGWYPAGASRRVRPVGRRRDGAAADLPVRLTGDGRLWYEIEIDRETV
jgi:uncharacterized membrane protein YeaQ/YmgE (transglycosylase-associated protein family)